MTSKKKIGQDNYQTGKDAESWEYLKAKIKNELNPLDDSEIRRHKKPTDPYDWVKIREDEDGKRIYKYYDAKIGNATKSEAEERRRVSIVKGSKDNPISKIRKFVNDL